MTEKRGEQKILLFFPGKLLLQLECLKVIKKSPKSS